MPQAWSSVQLLEKLVDPDEQAYHHDISHEQKHDTEEDTESNLDNHTILSCKLSPWNRPYFLFPDVLIERS